MQIHVLWVWLLLSTGFLVSSNSCLRNSLMSSSHLFLGLPIALWILYLVLSSGFQSAALLNRLSLGDIAILNANFHFIFCESCSSIEPLRFPSFPWHHLCFFLCIQSSLLLQSQLYQFLRSASSSNETSLSTSLWVVVLRPSPLSSSVLRRSLMSVSSISSLVLISCFSIFVSSFCLNDES